MISHIRGTLLHKDTRYVVISAAGVGYKVAVTNDSLAKLGPEGKEAAVWTYLAVRENALDLYGFLTLPELNFFELLITVSGIGPKTAMSILNATSIETLSHAISTGDTSHLTKVSGIGKKNAEKIVLELKDKLGTTFSLEGTSLQHESDAMEALTSLGYSQNDVRNVLKKLPKTIADTGEKIKAALKLLGK